MKKFISVLDRAGITLLEGFMTEIFGRRGAVIFLILLGGLIPLSSLVNGAWIAIVLLLFIPADFPLNGTPLAWTIMILFTIGVIGIYVDACKLAERDVAGHQP